MIDLSTAADVATSGALGGALGVLGSIGSSVAKHFAKKRDHAHELAMREADLREIEAEATHADKRLALEIERDRGAQDAEIRQASYAEAGVRFTEGMDLGPIARGFLVAVDCVRGLTRPVLTGYLVHVAAPHLTPQSHAFLAGDRRNLVVRRPGHRCVSLGEEVRSRPRSCRTCLRCGRGLNALSQTLDWQLCGACLWVTSFPEPEPEPAPLRRPWWRRLI